MKKKKKESEVEIYLDNSDKQKTYKINRSETKDKILENFEIENLVLKNGKIAQENNRQKFRRESRGGKKTGHF